MYDVSLHWEGAVGALAGKGYESGGDIWPANAS